MLWGRCADDAAQCCDRRHSGAGGGACGTNLYRLVEISRRIRSACEPPDRARVPGHRSDRCPPAAHPHPDAARHRVRTVATTARCGHAPCTSSLRSAACCRESGASRTRGSKHPNSRVSFDQLGRVAWPLPPIGISPGRGFHPAAHHQRRPRCSRPRCQRLSPRAREHRLQGRAALADRPGQR